MVDRVLDLWNQRVLVPAGEGRQKSFVRPLEPDASYDSHESGEVRPSLRIQFKYLILVACALSPSS
jgi:hypothetical protein